MNSGSRRHAGNVQFGHHGGDQALVHLDGGRLFSAAEVQGHLHVQLGLVVHALEVDVQHQLLEGVVLHVAQQHLAGLAVQFHVQHAGVEGFLLQGVPQGVVVHSITGWRQRRKRCRASCPNCAGGGSHPYLAWRAQKRRIA
jgi:hypothetical protein